MQRPLVEGKLIALKLEMETTDGKDDQASGAIVIFTHGVNC